MGTYVTKEIITAKGFEDNFTIPYKGKILEKTFDKNMTIIGVETNYGGQNVILIDENPATNTIDKDTKIPYKGKAQFVLQPNSLVNVGNNTSLKQPLSVTDPELFKKNLEESEAKSKKMHQIGTATTLAKIAIVPTILFAFSKYKKYDNKTTAKVTIIGSVLIIGAVVLNGFSGAWTGTSFMDRTFGKQKFW